MASAYCRGCGPAWLSCSSDPRIKESAALRFAGVQDRSDLGLCTRPCPLNAGLTATRTATTRRAATCPCQPESPASPSLSPAANRLWVCGSARCRVPRGRPLASRLADSADPGRCVAQAPHIPRSVRAISEHNGYPRCWASAGSTLQCLLYGLNETCRPTSLLPALTRTTTIDASGVPWRSRLIRAQIAATRARAQGQQSRSVAVLAVLVPIAGRGGG
jgi:hypothetical protein